MNIMVRKVDAHGPYAKVLDTRCMTAADLIAEVPAAAERVNILLTTSVPCAYIETDGGLLKLTRGAKVGA